ncbi:hypothetical protein M409DRAFT_21227 [Zasmidium cellare ATCC 36951]|uniref:Uncharacterized protein n=1 Tax=Zasmidium cellare ATCC 36951 TaxID=1080233 RepID=A0A6A6CQK6_ZASCE|nr:uncharacterized protein M409DRAFT_21227 [Zasmidium cellare ATCC 36951]KAF2168478.1 hypothetical protein M409DRAFT_21227 [Zasmidium cellare ATCC 36951]
MSGVRDPAFWKRFSVAVHMDEEQGPEPKHSDSWLARQKKKESRRTWICWTFWLCFLALIAGVVAVIIWLLSSGVLSKSSGGGSSTTTGSSGSGSS